MPSIRAGVELDAPPDWAVLERNLIRIQSEAIEEVLERYVKDDGRILWPPDGGGYDDAYEGFSNWPVLYLLGGDDRLREASIDRWEAVTAQFDVDGPGDAHVHGVDEYPAYLDWMHQGEGHQLFYYLCLAAPGDDRFVDRARRFADLYLPGGDVENYDPAHRLIRGPATGSEGPCVPLEGPREYAEWMDYYHLPFNDLEGIETVEDLKDPEKAQRMGDAIRERMVGDHAVNLAATSMVTNAYLLTGEDRYREWVLEYVEAWEDRTERNGGIIPDNVGESDEIGENMDGKWYGGYYGWTWPHGWMFVAESSIMAGENAMLLDGDDGHFDMVRTTMEALADAAIERDGTLFVPYKHGDDSHFDYEPLREEYVLKDDDGLVYWRDGWYEFQPMAAAYPVHVWATAWRSADRDRIERLADHERNAPERLLPGNKKDLRGNDAAWVSYLDGKFPDYPAASLRHAHRATHERLRRVRADPPDFVPEADEYLNQRNPVDVEALIHCTLGGPMTLYNGGLLQGRIRHFDPERDRPGLPPDVAALVTDLAADRTGFELVNLGGRPRTTVVQAGVYGEHAFGTATYTVEAGDSTERRTVEVDAPALEVTVAPGTRTTIDVETRRFVNDPAAHPPWDR